MPINKKDYGPDWDKIAAEAKERAGWACEWCLAPHMKIIKRTGDDWEIVQTVTNADNEQEDTALMGWPRLRFFGLTKVVITTAHLDRNKKNHDPENLCALCQRCHLNHDILQHIANRKYGRHHKEDHQLKLFEND